MLNGTRTHLINEKWSNNDVTKNSDTGGGNQTIDDIHEESEPAPNKESYCSMPEDEIIVPK